MFLGYGKKLEYPEGTHAYIGRTCKLHTERPQLGIEPTCGEVMVLTTTPPCSPHIKSCNAKEWCVTVTDI